MQRLKLTTMDRSVVRSWLGHRHISESNSLPRLTWSASTPPAVLLLYLQMHVVGILEGSRRLWRGSHGGEPCTLFKIDAPGIKLTNEGEQELFSALSGLNVARALWWQGDLKEKEQPGILQAIFTNNLCKA
jgi:hypothetical protein